MGETEGGSGETIKVGEGGRGTGWDVEGKGPALVLRSAQKDFHDSSSKHAKSY